MAARLATERVHRGRIFRTLNGTAHEPRELRTIKRSDVPMPFATCDPTTTEHDFAKHVQGVLAADGREARAELLALMRESHPVYGERGAPAIVRMRGWVMLALERVGVTQDEVIPVLEALD